MDRELFFTCFQTSAEIFRLKKKIFIFSWRKTISLSASGPHITFRDSSVRSVSVKN